MHWTPMKIFSLIFYHFICASFKVLFTSHFVARFGNIFHSFFLSAYLLHWPLNITKWLNKFKMGVFFHSWNIDRQFWSHFVHFLNLKWAKNGPKWTKNWLFDLTKNTLKNGILKRIKMTKKFLFSSVFSHFSIHKQTHNFSEMHF